MDCDLQRDRAWLGQWYCGIHGVWFRCDEADDPMRCPAGEEYRAGYKAGFADLVALKYTRGERHRTLGDAIAQVIATATTEDDHG